MQLLKRKAEAQKNILVKTVEEPGCQVVRVRITPATEVAAREGYVCFWTGGREVRVGPLTPDQAEKLAEDLGYEAVE